MDFHEFTNGEFIYEIRGLVETEKYKKFSGGKICICRHCITGKKAPEIGAQIMEEGLLIASGSSLYTATPLGRLDKNEVHSLLNQNIEYLPKNSWESGIVVAMPVEIHRSTGESMYIGELTREYNSDKYNPSSIADRFCKHMQEIDPIFILGYFEKCEGGKIAFKFNEKCFAFMTEETKDKVFDAMKKIIEEEMQLPIISADTSLEDLEELEQRYSGRNGKLANDPGNYILKTIKQLKEEHMYYIYEDKSEGTKTVRELVEETIAESENPTLLDDIEDKIADSEKEEKLEPEEKSKSEE